MKFRVVTQLFTLALVVAPGCIDPMDYEGYEEYPAHEGSDDSGEPVVGTAERMSFNRMSFNALDVFSIEATIMVNEPLADSQTLAYLLDSAKGRELMTYVARCALDSGDKVVLKDTNGTKYAFPGMIGMFTYWVNQPLDPDDEQWLMACLLSHVNALNVKVPISVRGDRPELHVQPGSAEAQQFPYREGGFYGHFGDPSDPGSLEMYACYSEKQLAACGGSGAMTAAAMHLRRCTEPGGCPRFHVVGPCTDFMGTGSYACDKDAEGMYKGCYDRASTSPGNWPGSATKYVDPVITVYLEKLDCTIDPPSGP